MLDKSDRNSAFLFFLWWWDNTPFCFGVTCCITWWRLGSCLDLWWCHILWSFCWSCFAFWCCGGGMLILFLPLLLLTNQVGNSIFLHHMSSLPCFKGLLVHQKPVDHEIHDLGYNKTQKELTKTKNKLGSQETL